MPSMQSKGSIQTYGLYDAYFKRTYAPGTTVRQDNWWSKVGKTPSNKSSGTPNKFKKSR